MYTIVVTDALGGKRTDKLLAEQLPQFPRAALQKLFEKELVWLNDKITKPGLKVRPGDKLKADLSPLDIKIPDIELPILYEDENVLVINKPEGVISHARGRYFDEPSVASFVRQKTGQKGERSGIVHRLDRATSGVMVCAKNQASLSWLQKQFNQRKVKKSYVAVVQRTPEPKEAIIDMPIDRSSKKPQTFIVSSSGKSAITNYKVLSEAEGYSILELRPVTGRTHQLRVHLAKINHPIVGDQLYGGESADRLMLHAQSLEIILPNGESKTFSAPVPEQFNRYKTA